MAVIRISGAVEGAPEYFRDGSKQGSEFTRDELDERIFLFGDLDITEQIIQTVPGTGDRYLHITLSVKERELSVDTFRQIGADVKDMVLAAYAPDEMDFYCELQLPKIKNSLNKRTGEVYERFGHLHILVPLVNLHTGKKENPLGLVKDNLRFVDSLQEYINIKYNLASPKDNARDGVSKADIIDRTKTDGKVFEKGAFKEVKADLKTQLREKVGSAELRDYAAFQEYLKGKGELKIRKPGKEDEYLAFKPKGGPEFINLRDAEFRKAFFELPEIERATRLGMENSDVVKSRMFEKREAHEYEAILKDWTERRAKEVRYLNSGNKKQYEAYQALKEEPEKQAEMLAELEQRARAKQEKRNDEINRRGTGRDDAGDRGRAAPGDERGLGRTGRGQPDIAPVGTEPPPAARGRVRYMSELDVAGQSQGSQVLLPGDVRHELVEPRSERVRAGLRRADHQVSQGTGWTSDSELGQIRRDNKEAAMQREADAKPTIQAIKRRLDAQRLLADLAVTHLLLPSDYRVSPATDGSARIGHKDETTKYNVSDFMTKHMHMSWPEAQRYLEASYQRQLEHAPEPSVAAPARPDMWAAFQKERRANKDTIDATTKRDKAEQRETQREELLEANNQFKKAKARVRADGSLTPAAKKSAISVLTMEKVQADTSMKGRHVSERAEADRLRKPQEQYRAWLQRKAQAGELDALAELRAQRTEPVRKWSNTDRVIRGAGDKEPGAAKLLDQAEQASKQLQYTVARNGDVTYSRAGRELLVDAGRKVYMIDTSDQTLEQGLRLAALKWGGKMQLTGSDAFIAQAIRVAAKKNLHIEFSDPKQHAAFQEAKEAIRKDAEIVKQNIERHKKILAQEEAGRTKLPIQVLREKQRDLDAKATPGTPAPATVQPANPPIPEPTKPEPVTPATPEPATPKQPEQAPGQQVQHQVVYAPEPEPDDDLEQEHEIKPP